MSDVAKPTKSPSPRVHVSPAGGWLTESRRRAVFLALVEAQDRGATVAQSRQAAAGRFGLTPAEVLACEEEGVRMDWPLPNPPTGLPAGRRAG